MSKESSDAQNLAGPFRWLKPAYDEAVLFLMSFAALGLLVIDANLRHQIGGAFTSAFTDSKGSRAGGFLVVWAGVILGGLALSVFHVFTCKPKNAFEKTWMAAFAMATNGFAGILCGTELLDGQMHWQAIFPIWNIVSGVVLLYQMGLTPEDVVTDEPPSFVELIVGLILVSGVLFYCHFLADLKWPMTFSVCVVYATSLDYLFRKMLRKARLQSNKSEDTTNA